MFIYIFEDGTVKKGATFEDEDKEACDMGILEVISVINGEPMTWYGGEWCEIESAEEA